MSRYATVQGVGVLEFPDDASEEVIDRAVQEALASPIAQGAAKQEAKTAGVQAQAQQAYEARQAALAQQDKEHPELAPNPMVVDPAPAVDPYLEHREAPLPPSPVQKFGAQMKMDLLENENRQRQVMARSLFPDRPVSESMQRVGFYEGNPVYIDDNGDMQQLSSGMTKFLANMVANSPEMAASIVGAGAGPGGAAAGAAGAHGIKRGVASMIFNEPTTIPQNLGGMALEGGLSLTGEVPGRFMGAVGNRGTFVNMTSKQLKAAQEVQRRIKDTTGADVDLAQASGNRRLIASRTFLSRYPGDAADVLQEFDERGIEQFHKKMGEVLDSIASAKPGEIAEAGGVNAADAALRTARQTVSNKVRPLYEAAYAAHPDLGGPELEKFLKLPYMREAYERGQEIAELEGHAVPKPKQTTITTQHPLTGELETTTTTEPEKYDLRGLDYLKRGLDDLIDKMEEGGKPTQLSGALRQQRKALIGALDGMPAPEYQAARQLYGKLYASTVQPLENSPVGVLAKLKNKDAVGAAAKVFGDADVTPTQIALAKKAIMAENPSAWDDLTRTWLSNAFEKARTETQAGVEIAPGGKLRKQVYGNPALRKKMDEILSPAVKDDFDNLMFAAQKLSSTPVAGSNTMRDEEMKEVLKGRAAGAFKWVTQFRKRAIDTAERAQLEDGAKLFAEALTDPAKAAHLRRVMRMNPSTQQAILLSTIAAARTGGEAMRAGAMQQKPDSDIFAQ